MPPPARDGGGADAAACDSSAEEDVEAAVPAAQRASQRLTRTRPLNPAVVRAQRAEEVLQLKLEVRTQGVATRLACGQALASQPPERLRFVRCAVPDGLGAGGRDGGDLRRRLRRVRCRLRATRAPLRRADSPSVARPLLKSWLLLGVLYLVKSRRSPLYYAAGQGTRGNTIFNVVLSSCLMLGVAAVAAYSGSRLYRLRVLRRLRWADRARARATTQRQVLLYAYLLNCVVYLRALRHLVPGGALAVPERHIRGHCGAGAAVLAQRARPDQEDDDQHAEEEEAGKQPRSTATQRVRAATLLARATAPLAVVFVGAVGVVIASGVVTSSNVRTEQAWQQLRSCMPRHV
jgi:hypothetical protein